VNRTTLYALLTVTPAALAACGPVIRPDALIASIRTGMTQSEVYRQIGPPDREYRASGLDCFQYDLGNNSATLFTVLFDSNHRVAGTTRGMCPGHPV
jgi:hypothetical protein